MGGDGAGGVTMGYDAPGDNAGHIIYSTNAIVDNSRALAATVSQFGTAWATFTTTITVRNFITSRK